MPGFDPAISNSAENVRYYRVKQRLPGAIERAEAPAVSTDYVLSITERTRIVRRTTGDGAVILKQTLGIDATVRAQHETQILELLAKTSGAVKLATASAPGAADVNTIVLHDDRGTSLSSELAHGPLAVDELLELALRLARAVAAVHGAGIMHRDINPTNVLLAGTSREPLLIDFDLASRSFDDRPAFARDKIACALPYIAPEQTGRTSRTVDERADLYSLGATLYEAATGQAPFGNGDAFNLIRDHLARTPVPPIERNPALPRAFSDMLLRLLEKEPDRRYLSATGLATDLAFLIAERAAGRDANFTLARQDFPMRILPPSRLVGRDRERAELGAALAAARAGEATSVLVSGAPGVGKTALIDELRAMTSAHAGLFVGGKFDQYRHDLESDAVLCAFRALTVLLLAASEETFAPLRHRIIEAIGPNVDFATTVIPEFGALIGVVGAPAALVPNDGRTRLVAIIRSILGCVASKERPVVFVIDDAQWAPATPLDFLDALIDGPQIPGLLLVIAYRPSEVDAAHRLAVLRAKWRRLASAPRELELADLGSRDLATLLGEMLKLPADRAKMLARAVAGRTNGNPFDTVELVNALRKDRVLVPGDDGWHWNARSIRQHIGRGDVIELLTLRIDALPDETAALLEVIACLGGEVRFDILVRATGLDERTLGNRCGPALADGLIILEAGSDTKVRFRHDRVQQAAYGRSSTAARQRMQLGIARRLAERIDSEELAAEQYLSAIELVVDPQEGRRVVALMDGAAAQQALVADYAGSERYLCAALEMSHRLFAGDAALAVQLEAQLHNAYFQLGRLDEADVVFARIEVHDVRVPATLHAACRQISSLTNRHAHAAALALGMQMLARAGRRPYDSSQAEPTAHEFEILVDAWSDASEHRDNALIEATDARAIEVATIIAPMMPPAFFCDRRALRWLVRESMALWIEYGPQRGLVGPLLHASQLGIPNAVSYRAGRIVVEASAALHYEPETARARYLFGLALQQWFEPFDDCLANARAAHEGLVRGGDLHNACFTLNTAITLLFDGSETIDEFAQESDSALAFSIRTGNAPSHDVFVSWRQFARACRGETLVPGSFNDASFDEAEFTARNAENRVASGYYHMARASSAALFDDPEMLVEHAAIAMQSVQDIANSGWIVATYFLQACASARRLQLGNSDEDGVILRELDRCRIWLEARSSDNPAAYAHLLALVDAERAWALDDAEGACDAFEIALRDAPARRSPRHSAFVAERSARFHLGRGREHYARLLLIEARTCYERWRAFGKVRDLDTHFSFLQTSGPTASAVLNSSNFSSNDMDLVAILRASQALSSQTNFSRLEAEVRTLLAELTGATHVALLLYDSEGWHDESSSAGSKLLPTVGLRYVQRTRAPLVVADVARDERFARDPYFAGGRHASLLIVPIALQGELRAAVVIENHDQRGAFVASRLDAVELIAGQLAVSIENARLYASLERKVDDRTEALTRANDKLALLSSTDSLTGLANRRRFDEHFAAVLERSARDVTPVALILLDIDEFKKYNDHYGHPAGDACLRLVASKLSAGTRPPYDLVARYGGEEFVIVLTETDCESATQVAERLRAALEDMHEPHVASLKGFVTASFGVVSFTPDVGTDGEACLRAADLALYDAKHGGRNCVVRSHSRLAQNEHVRRPESA